MLNSHWYALTVKPRHERASSRYLRDKGLEEFSPVYRARRRWSDRWKEMELCVPGLHLLPGFRTRNVCRSWHTSISFQRSDQRRRARYTGEKFLRALCRGGSAMRLAHAAVLQ